MIDSVNSWDIPTEPYIEENGDTWGFCPKVLKNESFLSWFTRLSKENSSDARLLYHQLIKSSTVRKVNLKKTR